MSNLIINQVVEQMNILPLKLQKRVLEYVELLAKPGKHSVSGKKLLKFSGVIGTDDLTVMKKAIETNYGQVNLNLG